MSETERTATTQQADDLRQMDPPIKRIDCGHPLGVVLVEELPLRRIAAASRALTPILDRVDEDGNLNLSETLLEHPEDVINAVAATLELPVDVVDGIPAGRVLELLSAILELNMDFFFTLFVARMHLPTGPEVLPISSRNWWPRGTGSTRYGATPGAGSDGT